MAKNKELTILEQLFRSRNVYSILYNIKTLNFKESSKKIKQALPHPITKKTLFHASSLPKKYSQLRNKRMLPFSENLGGELAWYIQSLSKYSKTINEFIEIETQFENHILLENYDLALLNLIKIEDEICKSFWGLENLFSTTQKIGGDLSNWELLKEINSKTDEYYTLFFNANYSKKAESEMTLLQYKRGIENEMNSMSNKDSEYILFKLGYFFLNNYTQYAYIVNSESSSSIIDKYSTLIDLISDLSNSDEHNELVEDVLNELDKIGIKDKRLNRLKELNNIKVDVELNDEIIKLIDSYSIGDFEEVISNSNKLFIKYPESIEIYEIYIKSIIESGTKFISSNSSAFIDIILKNLFSIYTRDSEYYTSRENLLKIYLTYPRLNFFKKLLSLVSSLTGIQSNKNVLSNNFYVYSCNSNPSIILSKLILKDYFKEIPSITNHISHKINYSIATGDFSSLNSIKLPENKLEIYKARSSFINENYSDCLLLLEKLYSQKNLKSYVEEETIYLLFCSYILEKKYDEAVKIMVDSNFKNKYFIERLNGDNLYNIIVQNGYNVIPSIDLPILFYINNATSYQKYVSLEIYLNSIEVEKPSEILIDNFSEKEIEKYLFILSEICDLKVLNYFYSVYIDDNEVIEERKEILRKLILIDKSKSNIYLDELASITQKEKIKSIIQVVNDGKIRLNFTRIKDNKDINLENNFNRFVKFREFSKNNNLSVVDTQLLFENYLSEITTDSTKLQDASFVSFKGVYFEVIEHFLFSEEHGLDGDISTRIRHGVLENQLRKIFLNTNLIALKNKYGKYEDIIYWNEYGENEGYLKEVILQFQDVLKNFSKSIDDKIDFIVNEQMQIFSNRYNKKKQGLFNYYYTDEYLWILYKETTENVENYDDFLNFSFEMIKEHTDSLLFNIRDYFRFNLNSEFNGFMEELESEVKNIFPHQADIFSELYQVINNTKVLIQRELDLISEWFKVSNPVLDTSLDLKTIIETSVESINLIQAKYKIKADIFITNEMILQRFDYYIVIFGILLENIIRHSGNEQPEICVDIFADSEIVNINNNNLYHLKLKVSNEFCNIDNDKLSNTFKKIKENWATKLDKVSIEGGSGFQKINRILKYDIKSYDSNFDYTIKDNFLTISIDIFAFYKEFEDE